MIIFIFHVKPLNRQLSISRERKLLERDGWDWSQVLVSELDNMFCDKVCTDMTAELHHCSAGDRILQ